jgi:flagellar basal-body rod modification protein FlgD
MQVQNSTAPATAATQSATAAQTPVKPADAKQQVDYMKLIVAQMRNLNPMDPNSGGNGLETMMQAESLNQLAQLNKALKDQQVLTQTGYASSLLGRAVTGQSETGQEVSGTVQSVTMDAQGPVLELSGGTRLRMLDITKVTTA